MSDPWRRLDEIPVTLVVVIVYVTLFVVCRPFDDPTEFRQRLADYGWLSGSRVAAGEPWRLLSYAFLHGNVLHLLFNLSTLLSVGPALERTLGSVRFLLLYVISALGGGLGTCLLYPPGDPVVGGSGALFGMLGGAIALNMRSGRHLLAFLDFEGPRRLMANVALNLAIGYFLPFISNTCHVGGLIAGFVLTFLWLAPGRPSALQWAWRLATAALLASLTFAALLPVTRHDWLDRAREAETNPARKAALGRAQRLSD